MPSLISTIRAGGGPSWVPETDWENVSIDDIAAKIASPVAVDSDSCSESTARLTDARSVVGDTSTAAVPANATSPRFTPGVSWSANDFAAACAAARRVGSTSVACIDSDTSITSTTVARLRGTRASAVGTGQRDREQGQREDQREGGEVPQPPRAVRGDPVEQLQVRERDGVAAAAAQQQQVADGQRDDDERAAAATRAWRTTSSGLAWCCVRVSSRARSWSPP